MAEVEDEQAPRIRRQVEYYFSDENLVKDHYLHSRMKRNQNKPIRIDLIHGFRKMRDFQPFNAVVKALQKSEVLEVVDVNGASCVARKTPYIKPKNSHNSKLKKPTGFEPNWTEGPLRPELYAEEQSLFDPIERSFADRMESALHRYRSKRKFTPRIANIYTKFLKFGGIDTGQKQFSGGLSREELEDCSATEIASKVAIDFINEDKYVTGPEEKWSVDFEAVAKGFLSSRAPSLFNPQRPSEVKEIVNVLRNFYNYILLHDVCPEYTASVLAARRICDVAEKELTATISAIQAFPGDFQVACSTLFGGHWKDMYTADFEWCREYPGATSNIGMCSDEAKRVFGTAIAALGLKYDEPPLLEQQFARKEYRAGLEIIGLIEVEEKTRVYYAAHAPDFKPVGKLVCRPYRMPEFSDFECSSETTDPAAKRPSEYVFLVEESILRSLLPGMKMEATIHTLDGGLQMLDNVLGVYCSFYTLLYNEFLQARKERRKLRWYERTTSGTEMQETDGWRQDEPTWGEEQADETRVPGVDYRGNGISEPAQEGGKTEQSVHVEVQGTHALFQAEDIVEPNGKPLCMQQTSMGEPGELELSSHELVGDTDKLVQNEEEQVHDTDGQAEETSD